MMVCNQIVYTMFCVYIDQGKKDVKDNINSSSKGIHMNKGITSKKLWVPFLPLGHYIIYSTEMLHNYETK